MRNIIFLTVLFAVVSSIVSCSDNSGPSVNADSPMAAYQNLFKAVKSKNTEAIKATMTKATQEFVKGAAAKNNKPESEVYANGLTATTITNSDTIPEMRDERVNENFGAVEVWNIRDKRWEDLPFMKEDGQWKLAIGEAFSGVYKSPGMGRARKEAEAANVMRGNTMIPGATPNPNIKEKIIDAPKIPGANTGTANTGNRPVTQK